MSITLRRCGDRAWLIDCTAPDRADLVHLALAAHRPAGVVDLVPAAATVLVRFDPGLSGAATVADRVRSVLDARARDTMPPAAPGRTVEIPVVYDGPDLAAVAELLGHTVDEVVQQHVSARWRSDFIGFAPGFAYLSTPDLPWRLPRRATSRPAVPPGSVGLADAWTGIYPRASPGGWQLIGRTTATLWDVATTPPALLAPGTGVRFVPVDR